MKKKERTDIILDPLRKSKRKVKVRIAPLIKGNVIESSHLSLNEHFLCFP